jgi:hypothetical protein
MSARETAKAEPATTIEMAPELVSSDPAPSPNSVAANSAPPDSVPAPTPAAERMRRCRERRRKGLRFISIELRETEITELVRRGLLNPEIRHDPNAVIGALYAFLDHALSA